MAFKPIEKLAVTRTLSDSTELPVGILAQNRQGVYFQYDQSYLNKFGNLSPFSLAFNRDVQLAPKTPHNGLHGVFSDCLPDGWGLLLQDRIFRQQNIMPNFVTAMDRLSFVGDSAMGALSFSPTIQYADSNDNQTSLATLGQQAQAIFDGQTEEVLSALVAAGSSGGARPKAQIYFPKNKIEHCRTVPKIGDEAWLIKFTSKNLALGHEEGLCEAAYLDLAEQAGLNPPERLLVPAAKGTGAAQWLALKRFDRFKSNSNKMGCKHMHSACGLLDADFRTPSLDYIDLIKASRALCKSPAAGQLQFRRAIFNLLSCNQDDHSKNWAFLQDDSGGWDLAPFYDVTFSPHPFGEHATSFAGYGKAPTLKAVQQLASAAGYASWKQVQGIISDIADAIFNFKNVAQSLDINKQTIRLIEQQLNNTHAINKHLITG
ncbi:type II toxin-antitoxin system HipA family toxin [Pseudoalteromonas marina]|jgi:serine/threonine-protein kinase HipA|uniref:type II toxin-antitoxin system HipA family toxin n=1 Tax=Pseudoalteromonas marina TaxID=267375 RepID=UPI0023F201A6|nr:type II toxin-antitoxin system HipA family toxin [Pseudoalteromonas marina]